MNQKFIVIDGRKYNSVEEMPPDVCQKYEQAMSAFKDNNQNNIPDGLENMKILGDKNNNGVPDILENLATASVLSNSMKFIVNGQEFKSLEDLPPEARAKYQQAMGNLDKNQNGIPDILEGMMNFPNQTPNTQNVPMTTSPLLSQPFGLTQNKPIPVTPSITSETSNGWVPVLVGVLLLFLCVVGAAGIWYFFIR